MIKQTAGRDNLGELAPKFAELNDDVLFGKKDSKEEHGGAFGLGEPFSSRSTWWEYIKWMVWKGHRRRI